jgi:hypothetical protein
VFCLFVLFVDILFSVGTVQQFCVFSAVASADVAASCSSHKEKIKQLVVFRTSATLWCARSLSVLICSRCKLSSTLNILVLLAQKRIANEIIQCFNQYS